jgi:tellurite resistance protein
MAVKVMAADGIIRTSEREMLLEAAASLGLDGDLAADIVKLAS